MFWESLLLVDQKKKKKKKKKKNTVEVPETFLVNFVFDKQCVLGTNLSV